VTIGRLAALKPAFKKTTPITLVRQVFLEICGVFLIMSKWWKSRLRFKKRLNQPLK
jgi:hypothetical protein